MITLKNHATSVLSQNLRSNVKCSAESPPDMISILLHHALYPGGWPVCFAFWILLGFGQSKAPVANQKMEGKRGGGSYSPDSLFARCRLAMAPHLPLPTAQAWSSDLVLQLQLSQDSGNHSFFFPMQIFYRSPMVVVSLVDLP